jgi:hypothetical protein
MIGTMTKETIGDKIDSAFPGEVRMLRLQGPDGLQTPHFGLFRDDTWECLDYAPKKGYVPHTRDDVKALGEAASEAWGDVVDIDCGWHNGHRLTICPSKEHRRSICGTNDNLFPRCFVYGGYNGRAFSATLGAYYDRCQNLMMISSAGSYRQTIRHTSGLRGKMDSLIGQFSSLANQWQNLGDIAAEMQTRESTIADYIAQVYPLPSEATDTVARKYQNRAVAIVNRIIRERQATFGRAGNIERATMWELYNGVQGYIQHDKTRRNSPSTFQRQMLALEDTTVNRALQLSLAA